MNINNLLTSYGLEFFLMLRCPDFQVFWGFVPHYPCFSPTDPAELTFLPYMYVS